VAKTTSTYNFTQIVSQVWFSIAHLWRRGSVGRGVGLGIERL